MTSPVPAADSVCPLEKRLRIPAPPQKAPFFLFSSARSLGSCPLGKSPEGERIAGLPSAPHPGLSSKTEHARDTMAGFGKFFFSMGFFEFREYRFHSEKERIPAD